MSVCICQCCKSFIKIITIISRLKWSKVGQDKVILHQFNKGGVTPSPSPFVLKLETYLRMAGIPYEVIKIILEGFFWNGIANNMLQLRMILKNLLELKEKHLGLP